MNKYDIEYTALFEDPWLDFFFSTELEMERKSPERYLWMKHGSFSSRVESVSPIILYNMPYDHLFMKKVNQ